MLVLEHEEPELYDWIQAQNLSRQYDLMTNCIEIGIKQGPTAFDKYFLWALNHVAVVNISAFGGRFREEPIYVGDHRPPHYREVPDWMDRFISNVHENWYIWTPTELAAYGLWRLNWIHQGLRERSATTFSVSAQEPCSRVEKPCRSGSRKIEKVMSTHCGSPTRRGMMAISILRPSKLTWRL